MSDPFKGRRPIHEDFWLISQGLIEQDAQSETGQSFEEMIGRYVDPASLTYVAEQRALRLRQADPKLVYGAHEVQIKVAGAWLDAFIQGIRFQQLKHHPDTIEETP